MAKRAVAGTGTIRLRWEFTRAFGVYVVWQYLVWLFGRQPAGPALRHGLQLWHVEQLAHVDVEVAVQGWWLGHPVLVDAANVYYGLAHVAGMALALVWAWRRGPDVYRQLRQLVLWVTGLGFAVQLWQVAPLRLLPVGIVDTAARHGISVYDAAKGHVDVFSAFPSLHVGWALAVALVLWRHGGRVARLAALHGPLTVLVVVVTGNHSVLDVAGAASILAAAVAITEGAGVGAGRRVVRRITGQRVLAAVPAVELAREAA